MMRGFTVMFGSKVIVRRARVFQWMWGRIPGETSFLGRWYRVYGCGLFTLLIGGSTVSPDVVASGREKLTV